MRSLGVYNFSLSRFVSLSLNILHHSFSCSLSSRSKLSERTYNKQMLSDVHIWGKRCRRSSSTPSVNPALELCTASKQVKTLLQFKWPSLCVSLDCFNAPIKTLHSFWGRGSLVIFAAQWLAEAIFTLNRWEQWTPFTLEMPILHGDFGSLVNYVALPALLRYARQYWIFSWLFVST